ncbi:MAG: hypothetical protein ABR991_06270 [Terracidiphilus sp.]
MSWEKTSVRHSSLIVGNRHCPRPLKAKTRYFCPNFKSKNESYRLSLLICGYSEQPDFSRTLLKKDIYHAKDQIVATLSFWKAYPPFSEKIAGLIICSRSPMSSSELQVMKAKVQNQHHLSLIVDENGKKEYDFAVFI